MTISEPSALAAIDAFELLFSIDRHFQALGGEASTSVNFKEAFAFLEGIIAAHSEKADLLEQIFLKLVGLFCSLAGPGAAYRRSLILGHLRLFAECFTRNQSCTDEIFRRLQMAWTRSLVDADLECSRQVLQFIIQLPSVSSANYNVLGLLREAFDSWACDAVRFYAYNSESLELLKQICLEAFQDAWESTSAAESLTAVEAGRRRRLLLSTLFYTHTLSCIDVFGVSSSEGSALVPVLGILVSFDLSLTMPSSCLEALGAMSEYQHLYKLLS